MEVNSPESDSNIYQLFLKITGNVKAAFLFPLLRRRGSGLCPYLKWFNWVTV